MTHQQFWALVKLLTPYIKEGTKKADPNGFIAPSLRISAAIRYFAGGSPYDIMLTHGISPSSLFRSVWVVVDAINDCP
jgi:hypothetical protein